MNALRRALKYPIACFLRLEHLRNSVSRYLKQSSAFNQLWIFTFSHGVSLVPKARA